MESEVIHNGSSDAFKIPTTELYSLDMDSVAIAVPCVFGLIFIVGLIGNGCVICAVARYKSMWNAPNLFIVNVAVGDVLLILVSLPTTALIYTLPGWPFGLAVCKATYFIRTLSFGVSIFTLTMLSVDRVLVISRTMRLRHKSSVRIGIMIVAIWILAIIIALPDAIAHHLTSERWSDVNQTVVYCNAHPVGWNEQFEYSKVHTMVHAIAFFILPLIIISISYGIMAHVMVKSSHSIPGESAESSAWRTKTIQKRKKVAKIVIILVALFFICWLPRTLFTLVSYYGPKGKVMSPAVFALKIVAHCLFYLNPCVNPIVLYFLSKSFKTYYMRQLCCGKRRNGDTEHATRQSQLESQVTKVTQSKSHRYDQTDQSAAPAYELSALER